MSDSNSAPTPSHPHKLDLAAAKKQLDAFAAIVQHTVSAARKHARPVENNAVVVDRTGKSYPSINAALASISDATQQKEGDERQRPGHADDRQRRWDVADLVDLPGQRDREEAVTQQRDDRPGGEQREIAALERLKEPHGPEPRTDGSRQQRHRFRSTA